MKTFLLTLSLLSATAVLANDNPVQQMPILFDTGNNVQQQAVPAMPQQTSVNPAQQAIPVITPEMRRALIAQARRLAAQQAVPPEANQVDETNARRLAR